MPTTVLTTTELPGAGTWPQGDRFQLFPAHDYDTSNVYIFGFAFGGVLKLTGVDLNARNATLDPPAPSGTILQAELYESYNSETGVFSGLLHEITTSTSFYEFFHNASYGGFLTGDDTIYGSDNGDGTAGGYHADAGNDLVEMRGGQDFAGGGIGDDTVRGGEGDDYLWGDVATDSTASGNDLVEGDDGDDQINGGLGFDTLRGGAGSDTLISDTVDVDPAFLALHPEIGLEADGGTDLDGSDRDVVQINLSMLEDDFVIDASDPTQWAISGNFSFVNIERFNIVFGSGDDVFYEVHIDDGVTNAGYRDDVDMGAGNDILHFGGDVGFGVDNGRVEMGEGDDTVYFLHTTGAPAHLNGGGGHDRLVLDFTDLDFQPANAGFLTGENFEEVEYFGSSGVDGVTGNSGGTLIAFGGDGNDQLYGGEVRNFFEGGAGADGITGSLQGLIDTAAYTRATAAVTVNLLLESQSGGDAEGDTFNSLFRIDNLAGSRFGDTLIGDDFVNTLEGGAGSDTLSGGGGNDRLFGEGFSLVAKIAASGNDSMANAMAIGAEDFSLGPDPLIANATAIPHVTISATADDRYDWYAFTVTEPGAVLTFDIDGAERDQGKGFDAYIRLYDAAGNLLDSNDDVVDDDPGSTSTFQEINYDSFLQFTAAAAGTYYLEVSDYVQDPILDDHRHEAYKLHVSISGQAVGASDRLHGGAGADTLNGGLGADFFDFDAAGEIGSAVNNRDVIADFVQGLDLIDLEGMDALTNAAGHQRFTFLGTAAHSGAGATLRYAHSGGNTLLYGDLDANGGAEFALQIAGIVNLTPGDFTDLSIAVAQGGAGNDTVLGGRFAETLAGLGGNDVLDALAGNDTLRGGLGADTMTGGADADVFLLAAISETGTASGLRDVIADFDVAADRISLDGLDALTTLAGVQHFTFLGTAAHTGTGATLRFQQEGGNTVLLGDVDADGVDDFAIEFSGAIELSGRSFTDLSIASVLGSAAADALSGNDGAQTLIGLGANDTMNGFGGADTLRGGLGADTMTGGAQADRFDFNAVAEIGNALNLRDVITDFQQGIDLIDLDGIDASTVAAGVQHFIWLGTGAHTGVGATLRYTQAGGNTLIYADVDANGTGDFTIQLNGLFTLTAADFSNLSIASIQGTAGNDTLAGAPGGRTMLGLDGNDTIGGGAGADTILGGAGIDQLTGGLGADHFRWNAPSHTGVNAGQRDIVTDFQQGIDRLDLSAIDALTTLAGNQAFTFLGTSAHTGAGATLRYQQAGGNTIVYADVNANGTADFAIQLTGLHALTAADFVL